MSGAVIRSIELNGATYTSKFSFMTMRLADEVLPGGLEGESGGVSRLSALFWASLQSKHRISRDASDNLVDELGLDAFREFMEEAMTAYKGPAVSADEGNAKPEKDKTKAS